MPLSQLLPQLIVANLVTPIPPAPVADPLPKWYDPNARCAYHSSSPGHWTDRCFALKHKIQDLREPSQVPSRAGKQAKCHSESPPSASHGSSSNAGPSTNGISIGRRSFDPDHTPRSHNPRKVGRSRQLKST